MAIAVNPVNSTAYIPPVTTHNAASVNAYATYEEILALQDQNQLLTTNTSANAANDNILLTSDLLDLSPAALNVLNGISGDTTTTADAGIFTNPGINTNITAQLTPAQQQVVASVVVQFAGQPATPATFAQIQAALTAAGIDPSQLSIQQLLEGYSYAYVPGYAFDEQLLTETTVDNNA